MRVYCQRIEKQGFTAEGVMKEDLVLPQTYFGWSSEDVDMQASTSCDGVKMFKYIYIYSILFYSLSIAP